MLRAHRGGSQPVIMAQEYPRSERISGQLRRELPVLIQREVKDPEVGMVSVSDVEVSRDLGSAKVFITALSPEQAETSLKALRRAAGFLRGRLGKMLHLRKVPELRFYYDDSLDRGEKMDALIEEAAAEDAEARQNRTDDGGDDK